MKLNSNLILQGAGTGLTNFRFVDQLGFCLLLDNYKVKKVSYLLN